ncbi:MAG: tetratricopeptide repeat protein [bacterium]|nr:tetratricopeptide repeat protein [bacterium]
MARRDKKRAGRRANRLPAPEKRTEARPTAGKRAAQAIPKPSPSPGKRPRLPLGKRLIFHAVTIVLFFGLIELMLALAGLKPIVVDEDPYVGFTSRLRLYKPTGSGDELRTAANKLALFNDQSFPRTKRRGTSRIFTLGGSCTYGRPFDDSTSWTGWLRAYLAAVDSSRRWEVVNAGGISYASYRVATLMEELVNYEPDLFIIYSGHNEFLEQRTYADILAEPPVLTRTKLLLQHSRLWALGRKIGTRSQSRARQKYELTGEVRELLDTSAGLNYYFRDEPFKQQVLKHYHFNLQRMIALARSSGARVVLVNVPVNENFAPFKSQHRDELPEAERDRHARWLRRASEALDQGQAEQGRELASQALDVDPLFAEGHHLLGKALLALGRHDEAGQAFARAIAEDVCPLRALAETNELISETAQRTGTPLVDYRSLLKQEMFELAGHANLGDELFYDHAHPTVEANGILARALVEQMAAMGLVDLAADWRRRLGDRVEDEVLARVDADAQARAYKNLSKLLIWAGKKKEAEKYVQLATTVLGDDWELHYNAGMVHLDEQRHEAAVESFREAIRLNPGQAAAHDLLGQAYVRLGRPEAAIAAGRQAVAVDPGLAGAWNNLGTLYSAQADHAQALEAIREAIRLDPQFAEAHNNLGKVLFDTGELDEALRSYERAIALRPSYVEAMTNRGLVLGELGEYRRALEAFEAVLELEPHLAATLVGKAKALLALGDAAAATATLERVIELDPQHLEAYEILVHSLLAAGRPATATELVARGLTRNPQAAGLHQLQGRLLAQGRRYEAAAAAFARAIELEPDRVAAWIDLGNLRMAEGRVDEALGIYRRALESHPDDDRIHHVLATALRITGRIDEARSHLERALEIWPTNAAVAHDLGTVYEQLGELELARELYRRAARLDPSLSAARENAARLSAAGEEP